MENLTENPTDQDSGLTKALAIAFPENVFAKNLAKTSIRFHTNEINDEQFSNLHTILELYEKKISLKRSATNICVTITDKEVEDVN